MEILNNPSKYKGQPFTIRLTSDRMMCVDCQMFVMQFELLMKTLGLDIRIEVNSGRYSSPNHMHYASSKAQFEAAYGHLYLYPLSLFHQYAYMFTSRCPKQ